MSKAEKAVLTVRESFGRVQAMLSAYGPQYRGGKSAYSRSGMRMKAFALRSGGGERSQRRKKKLNDHSDFLFGS
jgi:hypothetical protein